MICHGTKVMSVLSACMPLLHLLVSPCSLHLFSHNTTMIGKEDKQVSDLCTQLTSEYETIAQNLRAASDKEMEGDKKIKLLQATKALEAAAIQKVTNLADALRAESR